MVSVAPEFAKMRPKWFPDLVAGGMIPASVAFRMSDQ